MHKRRAQPRRGHQTQQPVLSIPAALGLAARKGLGGTSAWRGRDFRSGPVLFRARRRAGREAELRALTVGCARRRLWARACANLRALG